MRVLVRVEPPAELIFCDSYRTTENIISPFRVISNVTEVSRNRIEADVTVKSTFESKLNGTNVIIKIPTPKNTGKVENKNFFLLIIPLSSRVTNRKLKATCKIAIKGAGKAKYNADAGGIVWKYVQVLLTRAN